MFYHLFMWFWAVNRMFLRLGLLWLTLNLALIIKRLPQNNIFFFNVAYPVRKFGVSLRRLHVPPGVRVHQVEDHCYRPQDATPDFALKLGRTENSKDNIILSALWKPFVSP
jgi:hypothetical protein